MKLLALAAMWAAFQGPAAPSQQPIVPHKWEVKAKQIAAVPFKTYYCPNYNVFYHRLPPSYFAQAALWPNCYIEFNTDPYILWDWPTYCTIMVHEVGHLAGMKHSPYRNNIMYFAPVAKYRLCKGRPPR